MTYSSGFLKDVITVLNRTQAQAQGLWGLDGAGITWQEGSEYPANVGFARGTSALNAGTVDAYMCKLVRLYWNDEITSRSRIRYDNLVYQIIPETFHADYQENTLQFNMQLIVEQDENGSSSSL